jgi:hypothetical protein
VEGLVARKSMWYPDSDFRRQFRFSSGRGNAMVEWHCDGDVVGHSDQVATVTVTCIASASVGEWNHWNEHTLTVSSGTAEAILA